LSTLFERDVCSIKRLCFSFSDFEKDPQLLKARLFKGLVLRKSFKRIFLKDFLLSIVSTELFQRNASMAIRNGSFSNFLIVMIQLSFPILYLPGLHRCPSPSWARGSFRLPNSSTANEVRRKGLPKKYNLICY
jgi:hypothetical protein